MQRVELKEYLHVNTTPTAETPCVSESPEGAIGLYFKNIQVYTSQEKNEKMINSG
jgi:hypothetical protein